MEMRFSRESYSSVVSHGWACLAFLVALVVCTGSVDAQAEESAITVDGQEYLAGDTLFLDTFETCDEGQFPGSLLSPGLSDASRTDPVAQAFGRFHYEVSRKTLSDSAEAIRRKARELKGRDDFTVSGNFGSLMETPGPDWLRWALIFDYVNLEWRFNEASAADPASLTFFSLLNAIGRPATLVGKAENNRKWRIHGDNPVYHDMMVAEAYAMGHSVTVPYAMFDGTRGQSRYFGNIDRMAKVYQFISARKRLFDGYEPVSFHGIGVPADKYGGIYGSPISRQVMEAAQALTPYRIILSGEYLPPLDAEKYRGLETASLVGEIEEVRVEDRQVIEELVGRESAAGPVFKIHGSDKIVVLPRASVSDQEAPLVVHLLNKDSSYDGSTTTVVPASFTLRFHRRLVQGRSVRKVVLHTVDGGTVSLAFKAEGDYYGMEIPRLAIWGLLEVHAGDMTDHPGLVASVHPKRRPYPQSEIVLMRPGHRYEKPDHVVEALTVDGELDETRVVDLYGVTRISWEYRMFKGFREKGVAYVGTTNASHLAIDKKGPQWGGWVRNPDGSIMPDLTEANPLGVLSHATDDFHEYMVSEAADRWIDRYDANGIQWDGTPTMIMKAWQRGGDFSEDSVRKFRSWLADTYSAEELRRMGVASAEAFDIKTHMLGLVAGSRFFSCEQFQGKRCFVMRQKDPTDSETRDLVGTRTLRSRTGLVLITVECFVPANGSGRPKISVHLKDAGGEGLYGTYGLNGETLRIFAHDGDYSLPFPLGQWVTFGLLCDFDRQTAAVTVEGREFTPAYKLRRPGLTKDGFAVYFLKPADSRDVYVRKIEVLELTP